MLLKKFLKIKQSTYALYRKNEEWVSPLNAAWLCLRENYQFLGSDWLTRFNNRVSRSKKRPTQELSLKKMQATQDAEPTNDNKDEWSVATIDPSMLPMLAQ